MYILYVLFCQREASHFAQMSKTQKYSVYYHVWPKKATLTFEKLRQEIILVLLLEKWQKQMYQLSQ